MDLALPRAEIKISGRNSKLVQLAINLLARLPTSKKKSELIHAVENSFENMHWDKILIDHLFHIHQLQAMSCYVFMHSHCCLHFTMIWLVSRTFIAGVQLGNFKGTGCMVEMGHTDTGLPIETLWPSHDTTKFISFNNLIGCLDKNRTKLPSLPRRAGVAAPTTLLQWRNGDTRGP